MTIVPGEKIKRDPQTLLYFYPSMNAVRFQKLMQEYSYWKHVETAEQVAKMSGKYLIPRECLHWQRKNKFVDRRIIIQKKAFYVLDKNEMTKNEIEKYYNQIIH